MLQTPFLFDLFLCRQQIDFKQFLCGVFCHWLSCVWKWFETNALSFYSIYFDFMLLLISLICSDKQPVMSKFFTLWQFCKDKKRQLIIYSWNIFRYSCRIGGCVRDVLRAIAMASVFLYLLFFGLGLGIVLCFSPKTRMDQPRVSSWTDFAYLWIWRNHHPVVNTACTIQFDSYFSFRDDRSDAAGICHRLCNGATFSCALLGLQQLQI